MADEEYYLTSDYILDLAKRAPKLYESSEPIEKRQLLKFTLQNLRLDGSLVCYDEVKPFDTIRKYSDHQLWLPQWDSTRTEKWLRETWFPSNYQFQFA